MAATDGEVGEVVVFAFVPVGVDIDECGVAVVLFSDYDVLGVDAGDVIVGEFWGFWFAWTHVSLRVE